MLGGESAPEMNRVRRVIAMVLCLAALAAGCSAPAVGSNRPAGARSPASSPTVVERTRLEPPRVEPTLVQTARPTFQGTIAPIPADLAAELRGTTWRPGCPVPIRDLRLLTLSYWGFDGEVHEGPMVVNSSVAQNIVSVFHRLFRARFPIKHLALARRYRPNEDPNTKRSITASFNCRPVVTPAGPGTTLSMHSYGLAIDINPLQNPFVGADGYVRNRYARPYRDRSQYLPGMIHDGDVVVEAFEGIGWAWGGGWSGGKDYMHFSLNGR